jgi:hypothetical protein
MAKSGNKTRRTVKTATPVMARSVIRRRKLIGGILISVPWAATEFEFVSDPIISGHVSGRQSPGDAPNHDPSQGIHNDSDKEQRQTDFDQSG